MGGYLLKLWNMLLQLQYYPSFWGSFIAVQLQLQAECGKQINVHVKCRSLLRILLSDGNFIGLEWSQGQNVRVMMTPWVKISASLPDFSASINYANLRVIGMSVLAYIIY